jgi:type I restriction enzyme M protein
MVKDAQKALAAKVATQYAKLTESDIKALVVDDKWLSTLALDVQTEVDRVSQALTGRVKQLTDRYATPLPQMTQTVEALAARVGERLKMMGFKWN